MVKKKPLENLQGENQDKEKDPTKDIADSFKKIESFQNEIKKQKEKIIQESENISVYCEGENKKIEALIIVLDKDKEDDTIKEVGNLKYLIDEIKNLADTLKNTGDGNIKEILEKLKDVNKKLEKIDFSKLDKKFSEIEETQLKNIKDVLKDKYNEEIGLAVKNKIHEWDIIDSKDYFFDEHQINQAYEQIKDEKKDSKISSSKTVKITETNIPKDENTKNNKTKEKILEKEKQNLNSNEDVDWDISEYGNEIKEFEATRNHNKKENKVIVENVSEKKEEALLSQSTEEKEMVNNEKVVKEMENGKTKVSENEVSKLEVDAKKEEKKPSLLKKFGKYIGTTLIGLGLLYQTSDGRGELKKEEKISKPQIPEKNQIEQVSDTELGKNISTEQVGGKTVVKEVKKGFFKKVEKAEKAEKTKEVEKNKETKSELNNAQRELAKTFLKNLVDLEKGKLKAPTDYNYPSEAPSLMNTKEYVTTREYVDKMPNQEVKNVFLNFIREAKTEMERDNQKGFEENIKLASDLFEGKNVNWEELAKEKVKKEKKENINWEKLAMEKLAKEKKTVVKKSNLTPEEQADEEAYNKRSIEIDKEIKIEKENKAKEQADNIVTQKKYQKHIEDTINSIIGDKGEIKEKVKEENVEEGKNAREFFEELDSKLKQLEKTGGIQKGDIKKDRLDEDKNSGLNDYVEKLKSEMPVGEIFRLDNKGAGAVAEVYKMTNDESYPFKGDKNFRNDFIENQADYKKAIESGDKEDAEWAVKSLENNVAYLKLINDKETVKTLFAYNKTMEILDVMQTEKEFAGKYIDAYKTREKIGDNFSKILDTETVKEKLGQMERFTKRVKDMLDNEKLDKTERSKKLEKIGLLNKVINLEEPVVSKDSKDKENILASLK